MTQQNETPRHFTITITEKQSRVIARALELQQRVHMGQLDHIVYELGWTGRFCTLEDTEAARPGYPPSLQEIGHAVGLASKSTVHAHLRNLMTRGYVTREAKTTRTLCLTPLGYSALGVQPDPPVPLDGKRWVPVLHTSEDVRTFLRNPHRPPPRIARAEALTPDRTVLSRLEEVQGVSP